MMRLPKFKEKHDWSKFDPIIKSELEKGTPIKEISKIIGIPYTTVYNHIVAKNFHRARKHCDHINPERIVRLYRNGMKLNDIAEACGCSLSTINHISRKVGCKRRYETPELDDILSLLEQGLTFEQVSLNVGKAHEYLFYRRKIDPEFKRLTDEARTFGEALNKEIAG